MKTPVDKKIVFAFYSHPMRQTAMRWVARLAFPQGADEHSKLALTVTDGDDKPVEEGIFELAGQRLPVKDGLAELSYADFIKGKHETALWLYRPKMPPVPGGLTFG